MPEKKSDQKRAVRQSSKAPSEVSPSDILKGMVSGSVASQSDVPWTLPPKPTPSGEKSVYTGESFFNPWQPPSSLQAGLVDPYRPTELPDRLWIPDDVGMGRVLRDKDVLNLFRVWASESPEYAQLEKRIRELSDQMVKSLARSSSAQRDVETYDKLVRSLEPSMDLYPPLRELRENVKRRAVEWYKERAKSEIREADAEWDVLEKKAINLFAKWVLNHSNPDVRARVVQAIQKEYGKGVDLSKIDPPWRSILEKYREETGRKPQRKSNLPSRSKR
jgi:hypothetical protein